LGRGEFCQGSVKKNWTDRYSIICAVELKEVADITKTLKAMFKDKMAACVETRINWLKVLQELQTQSAFASFMNLVSWLSVLVDSAANYSGADAEELKKREEAMVPQALILSFSLVGFCLLMYVARWQTINRLSFQVQKYGSAAETPHLVNILKCVGWLDFVMVICLTLLMTYLFVWQDLNTYVSFIMSILVAIVQLYLNYQEMGQLGEELDQLATLPSPFKSDSSKLQALEMAPAKP
jgi:hypothetical protein